MFGRGKSKEVMIFDQAEIAVASTWENLSCKAETRRISVFKTVYEDHLSGKGELKTCGLLPNE